MLAFNRQPFWSSWSRKFDLFFGELTSSVLDGFSPEYRLPWGRPALDPGRPGAVVVALPLRASGGVGRGKGAAVAVVALDMG